MTRAGIALSALAVILVSCIFPSFDKFEQEENARDAGEPDEVDSAVTPTPPDGAPDAPVDAAPDSPFTETIACGTGENGPRTCIVGFQYCCLQATGDPFVGCFGVARPTDCNTPNQRRAFCDGREDCPTGQECCALPADVEGKCASGCSANFGRIVCTGKGTCPTGQTCSFSLGGGQTACQ